MTGEVKDAAREVLAQLTPEQNQKLLKSDNRLEIKALGERAEVFAEQTKERKASYEKILQREAELAKGREQIAALEKDHDANALLDRVREILSEPEERDNTSPGQRALEALTLLTPFRGTATLSFVAEKLDADGLVDTIVETLPDQYFEGNANSQTLHELVQARLPSKNIDMVVDLLSYGLFDWAIRDYEAKFAYRVLLELPLAEQYRFRQREGGKYFMRLVSNLPKSDTGYRAIEVHKATPEDLKKIKAKFKDGDKGVVDEDEGLYDAGRLYAEKRAEEGMAASIDALVQEFKAAHDSGWKDEKKRIELFNKLAASGAASRTEGEKPVFKKRDQILLETVVHELDGWGYIEELFKSLSDSFLFSNQYRLATIKIMMARDPVRAAAHARDLVSHGFLDWIVTEREAYLAFICVKALPEDERANLIKNDPWVWKRIQSDLSDDMRKSPDQNLYVGDAAGTDRTSVLAQLAQESTWTEDNAGVLDGLLRMAIAMTEHKFAFERSQQFEAFASGKPALNALVKKYRLAENATQKWSPEVLKGSKWYEGIFQTLRSIWKSLVFLWDNDFLLVKRSVGFKNLDLNELQEAAGGDLAGFHLADPNKATDQHKAANPDANKLTLLVDIGAHALKLSLPELIIDSVNFLSPGGKIEAGSIRLKELTIDASYDTEQMDQPTAARIDVGSFEITDLLMAATDKMVAVSRFLMSTLHLGAGTKDTTTPSKAVPRGGYYFPIPFLATIGSAIYYLFKFKGWGTETPGREMSHGLEQIRALDLTFSSLEVQGLTTSGGQTVGNLKVADFALHIAMNKTTVLRAQIASLGKQIERKNRQNDAKGANELTARKLQAEADLEKLKADEDWMIGAQHRILHDKLSPDESKKLQDKIDALKFEAKGGQYLDIGSIEASGISGGVTVKSTIHLDGLHGEGTSNETAAGLGLGIVTDARLIEQMSRGAKTPTPFSDRGGKFRLDIDKFSAQDVSVGGGQVRSSSDIESKLKEIEKDKEKPQFAGFYEELQGLQKQAVEYEQYLEIGVSELNPRQLARFQSLRTILAKDPFIVFGSIDLVRAHVDVDLGTGGVGIGADQATLKNIAMPEKGLSADEVKGTNITANVTAQGGLAGWLDWKKNLTGGGVRADLLEVSGARDVNSGLLFEKATLKGGNAQIHAEGRDKSSTATFSATAGFDTLTVEGLGLEPRLNLMRRRAAALEENHKPSPVERKELDRLRKDIPALEALAEKRLLAVAVANKAKTPHERTVATQQLNDLDATIAAGLAADGSARLNLDSFGVRVSGGDDVLGDVLGGGFDRDKTLRHGVTIEGTGDDHQVLGHASLGYTNPAPDDARVRGKATEPTAVDIGPVKLNTKITKDETTNLITAEVTQLDLDSISLSEMMLTGLDKAESGTKIWSSGRSSLNGLKFKGSLVFAPVKNSDGDYRLAHIDITSFDIASIEARGLGYENSELKIEVRAKSGTVHKVHAEGMNIDLPADANADAVILGRARIESITNAELAASLPGGLNLAHGLLNAKNLEIEFLEGGGKTLSTDDLSLTAAELRGPDGWARFSLEHLSGAITMDKNGYKLKNVKLQKLSVPSLDWRAGETGRVKADQPVELNGLSVDGRIDMKEVDAPVKKGENVKPGGKPKKESKVVGVHIETFRLDSITAKHLTYKDGDTVVEVGPPADADKDIPKFMQKFRPFYIENFTIHGLDWTKDVGLKSGEINIEKYGAAVVYQDLKEHLKTGGALTGTGMHATFTGPNTGTATLGKMEKIAGFFKNKDLSTRFGATTIMESFTFGDNFVEMNNLAVENLHFGHTNYGEGTDRALRMNDAYVDKVTIDKVHVDYEKTKKDGEDSTNLKGIHVGEVKFTKIRANDLVYDGKSTEIPKVTKKVDGKDVQLDGDPINKKQHIEASSAWIDSLRFDNIDYNAAEALTKFDIHVEEAPGQTQYAGRKPEAFGVSGLAGRFISKFSDGTDTVATLAARLSGGPIDGRNITLQTMKLGVEEGTNKPITRTAVSGSFNLTRVGLENIDASYKGRDGVTTTVSGLDGKPASIEITDIAPQFNPNGTMIIPDMNAQAANFTITRGDLTAVVPLLDIKDIAFRMSGLGTAQGLDKFRVDIGSISVSEAMRIVYNIHKKQTTQDDVNKAKANPSSKIFAEPLGGMNGRIVLHTSAGPERIPIQDGKIDFDAARPYIIGIDHRGIYIGRVHYHKIEKEIPGVHEDEGDRGKLYLQELVETQANQPPTVDKEAPKDDPIELDLESDGITLGKGKMGLSPSGKADSESFYIELPDSTGGENTIVIPKHQIGEQIQIDIPKFHASGGAFPGGSLGDISLDLSISVRNLAKVDMSIVADVRKGMIEAVTLGDATLALDPKTLKNLPAPTAKDVDPKAKVKP